MVAAGDALSARRAFGYYRSSQFWDSDIPNLPAGNVIVFHDRTTDYAVIHVGPPDQGRMYVRSWRLAPSGQAELSGEGYWFRSTPVETP